MSHRSQTLRQVANIMSGTQWTSTQLKRGHTLQLQEPTRSVTSIRVAEWSQLSLAVTILWFLLQPYAGIRHDARLYTLQALSHQHPKLYSSDIFLKYGSQDSYTWFTPIYAQMGAWLGIEHAAALLTAFAQLLLLGASWWLAKRHTSASIATLTTGLILILPSNYGSDFIFTYFETFITPRLLAEGLTVLALIFWLSSRRWLATTLLCIALLMHPIMAMAGVAFIAAVYALKHPRACALLATGCLIISIPVLLSPLGNNLRFDDQWLTTVNTRSPYLFLKNWLYADWARLAVPGVTLWLSTLMTPTTHQRTIAKAALLTGSSGLLITLLGNDILRLIIVTQSQAWRWLWLSTLLALLLLIPLMQQLWVRNKAGRATVFLLWAAWLVRNEPMSLGLITFAAATGMISFNGNGTERHWGTIFAGSAALLATTIVWMIMMNLLEAGTLLYTYHWPNWTDRLRELCDDGLIPIFFLGGIYLTNQSKKRWLQFICAAANALIFVILGWHSWQNWIYEEYSPAVVGGMREWRALIPEGEAVLWLDGATPVWLALQRPNYISDIQTAAVLFARPAAMIFKKRATEIQSVFPNAKPLDWIDQAQSSTPITHDLLDICSHINVNFFVTNEALNSPPLATASADMPVGYRQARLYQCKDKS